MQIENDLSQNHRGNSKNLFRFALERSSKEKISSEFFIKTLPEAILRISFINKQLSELNIFNGDSKFLRLTIDFTNALKIYESHLKFLQEINENKDNTAEIIENYSILKDFKIILRSYSDICLPATYIFIKYLDHTIIANLEQSISKVKTKKITQIEFLEELFVQKAKLQASIDLAPLVVSFNNDDIFMKSVHEDPWPELYENSEIKKLGEADDIRDEYYSFTKTLHAANLALCVQESLKDKNSFIKTFAFGMSAAYFWMNSEKAFKKSDLFFASPTEKIVYEFWNLNDKMKSAKNFMKILNPRVETHKKIYIDRLFEPITLKEISSFLNIDLEENPESESKKECLNDQLLYKISQDIFTNNENKLQMRLICDTPFIFPGQQKPNKKTSIFSIQNVINCCSGRNFQNKVKSEESDHVNEFDTIILHVHGGGFVSQSSSSHQIYTREWAKALKIPILSLDYRLAPEHPYPAALDDCWQAYNWILSYSEKYLGLKFKKIILAGDSAGGNLILGLTYWAILKKKRIPDGLFLCYPALNLDLIQFSPSLLLALEDRILPYSILRLCINSYIQREKWDATKDPFLSPILAPNEILCKIPLCRMIVGDFDPLHDHCWKFLKRLLDLKKDAKLIVYKDMPHGFLNYGIPNGISYAKICVKDSCDILLNMTQILKNE